MRPGYHIVKNSKLDEKQNYVNWDKNSNKEDVGYAQKNNNFVVSVKKAYGSAVFKKQSIFTFVG